MAGPDYTARPIPNIYRAQKAKTAAGGFRPRPAQKTDLQDLLAHPPQELIQTIEQGGVPERTPQPKLPPPIIDHSNPFEEPPDPTDPFKHLRPGAPAVPGTTDPFAPLPAKPPRPAGAPGQTNVANRSDPNFATSYLPGKQPSSPAAAQLATPPISVNPGAMAQPRMMTGQQAVNAVPPVPTGPSKLPAAQSGPSFSQVGPPNMDMLPKGPIAPPAAAPTQPPPSPYAGFGAGGFNSAPAPAAAPATPAAAAVAKPPRPPVPPAVEAYAQQKYGHLKGKELTMALLNDPHTTRHALAALGHPVEEPRRVAPPAPGAAAPTGPSGPPRLQSDNEAGLAAMKGGRMPNITASPNFGAPQRPGAGADPVVRVFKPRPDPGPQFVNADGKPMLNDPKTLDARVAAAKAKLPGRTPPSAAEAIAAGPPAAATAPGAPAPATPVSLPTPAAKLPPAPPLAHEGPPANPLFSGGSSKGPSPLEQLQSPPGSKPAASSTTPVSLATSPAAATLAKPPVATDFTRFTPPSSPATPAPVLKGPITDPAQVEANKSRYAQSLASRQQATAERGIARGQARSERLEARKRGPSALDIMAQRNPAIAAEMLRQQGQTGRLGAELQFRKGEGEANRGLDRARLEETAKRNDAQGQLARDQLAETGRANRSRESFQGEQLTSNAGLKREELKSAEKRAQILAGQSQEGSAKYWLADASAHLEAAKEYRAKGRTREANEREAMARESRARAKQSGPTAAEIIAQPPAPTSKGPPATAATPGQVITAGQDSQQPTAQEQAAMNENATKRMYSADGKRLAPDALLNNFSGDLDAAAANVDQMTPEQARQFAGERGISEEALQKIVDHKPLLPYQHDSGKKPGDVDVAAKLKQGLGPPEIGPLSAIPWAVSGEAKADYISRVQRQRAADRLLRLMRSRSA